MLFRSNNLSCQYTIKCLKENERNKYVCNTNIFNNTDVLCEKLDVINNNYDNTNIKYFIEACKDLDKNGEKIYKCKSPYLNLENFNTNNKNYSNDIYTTNLLKYSKESEDLRKIIKLYEDVIYNYDVYCYSDIEYGFCYLLMNAYCLVFHLICLGWVIVGIEVILTLVKCKNEDEANFINDINNYASQINSGLNKHIDNEHNNEDTALKNNS